MLWVMRHRLPPPSIVAATVGSPWPIARRDRRSSPAQRLYHRDHRTTPTDVDRPLRIITSAADAALYMDTQAYELKEALANSGVTVERNRDDIILRMPGAAAFEPDKAEIKPAFRKSIAAAARYSRATTAR
jgi:outer membrane protein OmpA-like peptidoglycan-associated protein